MPGDFSNELRHALRHLRRSPGFCVAALLTLGLSLGAGAAMFSLLNALVLRSLPIRDPHGLIAISGRGTEQQMRLTPIPAVEELSRDDSPVRDVCGYNGGALQSVSANGGATQVIGALVTGRCFDTFGVAPILGRTINESDAPLFQRGNLVTVISHRLWMRMFNGDPSAIGKPIGIQGVELIVIGVMPEGFVGIHADSGVDLFTPYDTWSPARNDRRPAASHLLGRLRAGVTLEQAEQQITARWPALLEQVVPAAVPAAERRSLLAAQPRVERIGRGISSDRDRYARPLTLMFGLAIVLLLLACLNLGGLLLSRAIARGPEMAMRLALGSGRWRLARQSIVENVLLASAGAAIAVPVAFGIVSGLTSFLPAITTGRSVSFAPDAFVLTITAAVAIVAGLLMSLLPIAVAAPRLSAITASANRTGTGVTGVWARGLLVAQVALSIVLVTGAALLARSLHLLQQVDPGVRAEGVVIAQLQPVPNGYRGIDNAAHYPPLVDRIASLPGVQSAGYGRVFPRLTGEFGGSEIAVIGEPNRDLRAMWEITSPAFFQTLGIPLLRGRLTSWSDNVRTRHVAVVSESLARMLVPGGDVVGRRVSFSTEPFNQNVEIVGVVDNATMGNPRQTNPPMFYRPALQMAAYANYPSLLVRVDDSARSTVATAIRQIVADSGREFVAGVEPLDELLARSPTQERLSATLAAVFAGLAIVLAFVGVFALLSYSVSRRTREIGVRTAVGAAPASVIWLVLREGVALSAIGVIIGLPAAFAGARMLSTLMFGVSPADPLTFTVVAVFFLALGVAAAFVPARRAASVDPVVALRTE
jgi:predicted permease